QLRHAALPVGELELVPGHGGADLIRETVERLQSKSEVVGKTLVHAGDLLAVAADKPAARLPLPVRPQFPPERPGMFGAERVEGADLLALERLADRLEERLAVLLDERLEEGQPEHLSFPFIDAGSKEVIDVVAQQVAVEERPAAMGLHEELDGGFLLGLA